MATYVLGSSGPISIGTTYTANSIQQVTSTRGFGTPGAISSLNSILWTYGVGGSINGSNSNVSFSKFRAVEIFYLSISNITGSHPVGAYGADTFKNGSFAGSFTGGTTGSFNVVINGPVFRSSTGGSFSYSSLPAGNYAFTAQDSSNVAVVMHGTLVIPLNSSGAGGYLNYANINYGTGASPIWANRSY